MSVGTRWDEKRCWEWIEDCRRWRGEVLHGQHMHWCFNWDGLPCDETTMEWPCCGPARSASSREGGGEG